MTELIDNDISESELEVQLIVTFKDENLLRLELVSLMLRLHVDSFLCRRCGMLYYRVSRKTIIQEYKSERNG